MHLDSRIRPPTRPPARLNAESSTTAWRPASRTRAPHYCPNFHGGKLDPQTPPPPLKIDPRASLLCFYAAEREVGRCGDQCWEELSILRVPSLSCMFCVRVKDSLTPIHHVFARAIHWWRGAQHSQANGRSIVPTTYSAATKRALVATTQKHMTWLHTSLLPHPAQRPRGHQA